MISKENNILLHGTFLPYFFFLSFFLYCFEFGGECVCIYTEAKINFRIYNVRRFVLSFGRNTQVFHINHLHLVIVKGIDEMKVPESNPYQ